MNYENRIYHCTDFARSNLEGIYGCLWHRIQTIKNSLAKKEEIPPKLQQELGQLGDGLLNYQNMKQSLTHLDEGLRKQIPFNQDLHHELLIIAKLERIHNCLEQLNPYSEQNRTKAPVSVGVEVDCVRLGVHTPVILAELRECEDLLALYVECRKQHIEARAQRTDL